MECKNCGVENNIEARFCTGCGINLSESGAQEMTVITDSIPLPADRFIVNDRFKVIKRLGQGGMGDVLLAEDVKLKRNVAIKSILTANLTDTTAKIRFLREAQTASQLDHPNICTIYEIYEERDNDYIVMQYIDGVTIDRVISAKKLSLDKITDIAIQICRGMAEAHAMDVMHRDIKPGNIMIDRKGIVKILDFGLAKFSGSSSGKESATNANLTEKGFVMGTVAYISPEQAKGKTLDWRTDIFSFGVVLYEMIEGRNPFKCEEQIETLYSVLNTEIEFTSDVPEELKQITRKALEKDKENRYANFDEMEEELQLLRSKYVLANDSGPIESNGKTEIIQSTEQQKLLQSIQKTSDKEDLGAIVSRIKKFSASTERVMSTRKLRKKLLISLPLLIIGFVVLWFLLQNRSRPSDPIVEDKTFYIYLHPFENKTGEAEIIGMLDHLSMESLNQFEEFKIINQEIALSLMNPGQKSTGVDLEILKSKFDIKYEITGKITKKDNFYDIDAAVKPYDPTSNDPPSTITTTGEKDSLLTNQMIQLSRGLYRHLYPDKKRNSGMKHVSRMYGRRWDQYQNIYKAISLWKRNEPNKAKKLFSKAKNTLIAKYYLSHINYFNGERKEAMELIRQIMPRLNHLTPLRQLDVQVMEARLLFKFKDEIKYLTRLKDELPFSPEVFFQLGESYFHHGAPHEAIKYYAQAIKLEPLHSGSLNHQGYCYAYLGKHIEANHLFQKVRDHDQSANSFDSFGDGSFYSGDLVNAESMKRRAVQPNENGEIINWPYQTLADIYILKAMYKKAETALEEYRKLKKTKKADASVLVRKAFIKYRELQFHKALNLINQSLETYHSNDINDNTAEAYWLKGLILLALDKPGECKNALSWLQDFNKQYNLDAVNFKAAYKYYIHLKARLAEKEGKRNEAQKYFQALLDIKEKLSYWITQYNYQFFHTDYARFLSASYRHQDALSEIEKCLGFSDVDTPYIPAVQLKAQILQQLARTKDARIAYEKLNELYGPSNESNYLRDLLKAKLSTHSTQ